MARTSLAPALPLAGACILPPGTKVGCLTLDAFSAETGVSYPDKCMPQTRANSIDRSVKSPSIESNRCVAGISYELDGTSSRPPLGRTGRSPLTKLRPMPFYQRLGDLPRKRHVQFRENGTLLTEEVMGLEGFTGNESILYHLQSPCRVMELAGFEPIEREEWVPRQHAHRHFKTFDTEPGGDEITCRRLLMWNNDVEVSLC